MGELAFAVLKIKMYFFVIKATLHRINHGAPIVYGCGILIRFRKRQFWGKALVQRCRGVNGCTSCRCLISVGYCLLNIGLFPYSPQ